MERFADRLDAGRRLGARLGEMGIVDAIVLGLPRGGVVVAGEVASALHAPLDVLVVRKLGVPFQPELAMGAIGEGDLVVVDEEIVRAAHVSRSAFEAVRATEAARVERLVRLLRGTRPAGELRGRTAVIVDDGVATGSTAWAACRIARSRGVHRLILAVPVIAPASIAQLEAEVDELVWLEAPEPFHGVGWWYEDFSAASDHDVAQVLAKLGTEAAWDGGEDGPKASGVDRDVTVPIGHLELQGHLTVPALASGLVLFAHGSGSGSQSPRNRAVAAHLNAAGHGTFLFDLLSRDEEGDRSKVFDIALLADRLRAATRWVRHELDEPTKRRLGYFGASTGAAAALVAAADPAAHVRAIVSRGGRVDLAGQSLPAVRAPTLLIVGGNDSAVLRQNRRAMTALRCVHRLEVIEGATHLFEEPGAIDLVAQLASDWFSEHLLRRTRAA
jgi:putative phosphoribosyl transferase